MLPTFLLQVLPPRLHPTFLRHRFQVKHAVWKANQAAFWGGFWLEYHLSCSFPASWRAGRFMRHALGYARAKETKGGTRPASDLR